MRDSARVASGRKSNGVYVVDLVRGLDVLQIDLPTGPAARSSAGLDGGVLALIAGLSVLTVALGLRRRWSTRA